MKKSHFCIFLSMVTLIVVFLSSQVFAVPQMINYQGMLTDGDGNPVTNPALLVHFRICDAQIDGGVLWQESHVLDVQNGIYNVVLGSTLEPGTLDPNYFNTEPLWLEVEVDGEPGPMEPRQRLTSVPYALKAEDADTLDGLDSTTLNQSAHVGDMGNPHSVTAGQIGAVSASLFSSHSSDSSAHHTKTTSFSELTDQVADAQIPDGITRDSELGTKADSGHTHDDSYYLKSEFDNLFNTLYNLIVEQGARIAELESKLQYLILREETINGMPGPHMIIEGANLHVRNSSGSTDGAVDGLGNLIIGYNETRPPGFESCSLGARYEFEFDCVDAGGQWWLNEKGGSHNLVIGSEHNYSSYGGLIAGSSNTVSAPYSSVSGGDSNTARGDSASVSGGHANTASGEYASVSGGILNTASSYSASVSGGRLNRASNGSASVSGGNENEASGVYASVCGGTLNSATGSSASVSGGSYNTASGAYASVIGGSENRARGLHSFVGGGGGDSYSEGNLAWSNYSAILGGSGNVVGDTSDETHAIGSQATVSGGYNNEASGSSANVTGGRNNIASGDYSFIGGGGGDLAEEGNLAWSHFSAVLGGTRNWAGDVLDETHASGTEATVSGGYGNRAQGNSSSISGGKNNETRAAYASVSSGEENIASGSYSSVSGGRYNFASGDWSCVSGGNSNDAEGNFSSVSGGNDNTAGNSYASVTGGRENTASGAYASVTGGQLNDARGIDACVSGGYNRSDADDYHDWQGGHLFSEQ